MKLIKKNKDHRKITMIKNKTDTDKKTSLI